MSDKLEMKNLCGHTVIGFHHQAVSRLLDIRIDFISDAGFAFVSIDNGEEKWIDPANYHVVEDLGLSTQALCKIEDLKQQALAIRHFEKQFNVKIWEDTK